MLAKLIEGHRYRIETISHLYEKYFIGTTESLARFADSVNGEEDFSLELNELNYFQIEDLDETLDDLTA